MELIKRHYEKVILLGVFLLVILAMLFAISAINETREISDDKLRLPRMKADYEKADPASERFQTQKRIQSSALSWSSPSARNAALCSNHYSDLVIFPGVAMCPFCRKMIPGYYFDDKHCPECDQMLPKPERPKTGRFEKTESDQDADGLPDEWEARFQIKQNVEGHALRDDDNDGFSNLYEYTCNTEPNVPRDHPPLWHRIVFTNVHLIQLPVNFKALTAFGDDKNTWKAQVEIERRGTKFWRLNNEVVVAGRHYIVVDMEKKLTSDGKDESTLTLKEKTTGENPEIITMKVGQPTFSSDQRAVLEDIADPAFKVEVRVGDTFTIGNDVIGRENYKVKSFDGEKKEVVLEALDPDAKEKEATVTSESRVPEDMRVQSGIPESGDALPGRGPVKN
ncbi:MAG: hypothetical protein MJ033_01130 [Victivallaceae bacterium]|nr:hypothetical protein [Victivallaceae bacterium]